MTGIGISDNGPQVVNRCTEFIKFRLTLCQSTKTRPSLFTIMEQLGGEQLCDLVGYSVRWVIYMSAHSRLREQGAYRQGRVLVRVTKTRLMNIAILTRTLFRGTLPSGSTGQDQA